jgi:hypothetical protein
MSKKKQKLKTFSVTRLDIHIAVRRLDGALVRGGLTPLRWEGQRLNHEWHSLADTDAVWFANLSTLRFTQSTLHQYSFGVGDCARCYG